MSANEIMAQAAEEHERKQRAEAYLRDKREERREVQDWWNRFTMKALLVSSWCFILALLVAAKWG